MFNALPYDAVQQRALSDLSGISLFTTVHSTVVVKSYTYRRTRSNKLPHMNDSNVQLTQRTHFGTTEHNAHNFITVVKRSAAA